jgi:hypothetical protein
MHRYRPHLVFAVSCGVFIPLLCWAIAKSGSPVGYFIGVLLYVPEALISLRGAAQGESSSDIIFWALVVGQWFIVGAVLSFLFFGLRGRK